MKAIRLLVLLLLSLALPVNGMAQALMVVGQGTALAVAATPAPSHHAHTEMAGESDCMSAGASSKASPACKSGQECKSSSLLQLSLGKPFSFPLAQAPAVATSEPALTLIPDAVWHPPRG